MSNGAIRISTKINTEPVKKGLSDIEKSAAQSGSNARKSLNEIGTGFKVLGQKAVASAKNILSGYNESTAALSRQSVTLERLQNQLNAIQSGDVVPPSLRAMETELLKRQKESRELTAALEELGQEKEKLASNVAHFSQPGYSPEALAKAEKALAAVNWQYDEMDERLKKTLASGIELEQKIGNLRMSPDATNEAQDLKNRIGLVKQEMAESEKKAVSLKDRLLGLAKTKFGKLGGAAGSLKKGFEGIGTKVDHLKRRITQLVGAAFIFNLMSQGLRKLVDGLGGALKSNSRFAGSLNQIKANLVTAFTPIYNAILPAINTLMGALSKITGTIAAFVSSLFGKSLGQSQANAEALYKQSQAYDAVGKSAEKAQGKLASFDTLEVNDTKGPETPGIDFSGKIEYDDGLLGFFENLKKSVSDFIGSIDFSGLTSSFDNLWTSLQPFGGGIVDILKDFWTNFLSPLSTWTIEDLLPRFFNDTADALNRIDFETIKGAFNELWESLLPFAQNVGNGLEWFYKNVLLPFGTWVMNDAVPAFLHLISGALDVINEVWKNVEPALKWIWENIISKVFEWTGDVVTDGINDIGDALKWVADNEVAVAILSGIAIVIGVIAAAIAIYNGAMIVCNAVTGVFVGIMTVLTSPITWVIITIGALIGIIILCIKHWDEIKEAAGKCWEGIKNFFAGAATWFNDTIVQPIKDFFGGMWDGLKKGASDAWEGVKNVFSGIVNWFKDRFTDAWEGVKKVFETGGKIFSGIKEGIENTFKTVVNGIIDGVNFVISIPFKAINGWLNIIKDIDIFGFKPFDSLWGYNPLAIPQIPKLATGGVAYAPMVAQIGEYAGARSNPEIVTPENLMRQIVREESVSGKDIVIDNLTLITKIGEDVLQRQIIKGIRLEEQAIGRPLLVS